MLCGRRGNFCCQKDLAPCVIMMPPIADFRRPCLEITQQGMTCVLLAVRGQGSHLSCKRDSLMIYFPCLPQLIAHGRLCAQGGGRLRT